MKYEFTKLLSVKHIWPEADLPAVKQLNPIVTISADDIACDPIVPPVDSVMAAFMDELTEDIELRFMGASEPYIRFRRASIRFHTAIKDIGECRHMTKGTR